MKEDQTRVDKNGPLNLSMILRKNDVGTNFRYSNTKMAKILENATEK